MKVIATLITALFCQFLLASTIQGQSTLRHPLEKLRTLNDYFPFQPPESMEAWQARRERLRRHVQTSLGLWPMPEKKPLNPVIHGKIDMGAYTIEKVYFESFPGFFVTGNLYRPAKEKMDGPVPGVLCPHGHFRDGRFRWATDEELKREIDSGAESFETNGRSPLQARCANLAMMGCVVFHYDMPGYADSQQITHDLAHGFRTQRADMNAPDGWGFFSPQAELRLQSIMGLQTWNSIRSLDFLCALPDVDASRIGVTGSSGGGTQTFILCAIDPRPAVAFPAVMVSTAMQGGCTCENCSNLRINAGNVDFAALFAPKPIGMTAADDWTKEMKTKGFPELRELYEVLFEAGLPALPPRLFSRIEFPHNYNQVSREAMYGFFDDHLELNVDDTRERKIEVLRADRLTVFDNEHPRPAWSSEHEKQLLKTWEQSGRLDFDPASLLYPGQLDEFENTVSHALESMLSHPSSKTVFHSGESLTVRSDDDVHQFELETGVLKASDVDLDSKFLIARRSTSLDESHQRKVYLFVGKLDTDRMRENLSDSMSMEHDLLNRQAIAWAEIEPSGFGETVSETRNRLVANGRAAAGYTFGYNRTVFAWRVSQVLYAIDYLREQFPDAPINILAEKDFAGVACVAFAACSDRKKNVTALRCNLDGFRFADVQSLEEPNFFPGAVKYGDIPGLLSLRHDASIVLDGERIGGLGVLPHIIRARNSGGRLAVDAPVPFQRVKSDPDRNSGGFRQPLQDRDKR